VLEDCTVGISPNEHQTALLIIRALTVGRPICLDELISAPAAVHSAA
jgi:hypothetical protein